MVTSLTPVNPPGPNGLTLGTTIKELNTYTFPDGSFIRFTVDNLGPLDGHEVQWLRYASSGLLQSSGVLATSAGDINGLTVQDLDDGALFVTWAADGLDSGSSFGVYGGVFHSGTTAWTSFGRINEEVDGDQKTPSVTRLAEGKFAVAWESYGQDGDSGGIYMKILDQNDASGPVLEFLVNTTVAGHQFSPSVTTLTDGSFLVAWLESIGGFTTPKVQHFDALGGALGSEIPIANSVGSSAGDAIRIESLPTGGFLVAFSSLSAITVKHFDSSINEVGQATIMSYGPSTSAFDIMDLNDGSFIIAKVFDFVFPTIELTRFTYDLNMISLDSTGGHMIGEKINNINLDRGIDGQFTLQWQSNFSVNSAYTKTYAYAATQTLYGTAGDDSLTGGNQNDTIWGYAGGDTLDGAFGFDQIFGGDGNDVLIGGTGGDTMTGGAGDDRYYVDDPNDVVIESLNEGNDTIYTSFFLSSISDNVENLVGTSASGHAIIGNALSNRIVTNIGNDMISAAQGDDTISSAGGNDRVLTGAGNDIAYGGGGDDSLYGQAGADTLIGETGNDVMYGGAGNDLIYGGAGNDFAVGEDGNDTLIGGDGKDTMIGMAGDDFLFGENSSDVLYGGAGNDRLNGGNGHDVLWGQGGNDRLIGGQGNDVLHGGDGDDTIASGIGNDTMSGGDGADLFIFEADPGNDVILDFTLGVDKIGITTALLGQAWGRNTPLPPLELSLVIGGSTAPTPTSDAPTFTYAWDFLGNSGVLYYDQDGNGAGAAVQVVTTSVLLTHADLILV